MISMTCWTLKYSRKAVWVPGDRQNPMYVGQALRELGWTQKRDWTRDGGGAGACGWLPRASMLMLPYAFPVMNV
jgi:hypothetical protein